MSDDRGNGPHYGEGGQERRDLDDPRAAEREAEGHAEASGEEARRRRGGASGGLASAD